MTMEEAKTAEGMAVSPLPDEEHWTEGRLVLPGGIMNTDGSCSKKVSVRQLIGRDEEVLSDRRYRNGATQVTDFLANVIVAVEGLDRPVDRDLAAAMLIGDRDYLLLRLRQMSLGDVVEQVMRCPSRTCGEKVDVQFLISEIAVRRVPALQRDYELALSQPAFAADETSRRALLRLPTGRDQEAIADLKDENPGAANTRLLSRVVLRLGRRERLDEEAVRELPLKVRHELTNFLCAASPGPDLSIDIRCPQCGTDMTYPFDLHHFFFSECQMGLDELYQEVHHLAFYYHWSEKEILALPRNKRRRYLSLLAAKLEHGRQADSSPS